MRMIIKGTLRTITSSTLVFLSMTSASYISGERRHINRGEFDFQYRNLEFQIISKKKRTVAMAQGIDLDISLFKDRDYAYFRSEPEPQPYPGKINHQLYGIDNNGALMLDGIPCGPVVVIPETVYDPNGIAYTVTDLAEGAINWVGIGTLVLPSTLERLNGGIVSVKVNEVYLPEGLKEIDGIMGCITLKSLHIPSSVESIRKNSLYKCGFQQIYLPPSVKILEDCVLSLCLRLEYAKLSGVESMGDECFQGCTSYWWANLPETLRKMGKGCFDGCIKLERVSLPWSEIKMEGCFNACPSIRMIEVLATDPYPFPDKSFLDVDRKTCKLVVPVGSEEKYKKAKGWKEFHTIVGELPAVKKSERSKL